MTSPDFSCYRSRSRLLRRGQEIRGLLHCGKEIRGLFAVLFQAGTVLPRTKRHPPAYEKSGVHRLVDAGFFRNGWPFDLFLVHTALGELRLSIRDKQRKEGICVIFYHFFPIFSTIVYISYPSYPLKMVSFMVSQPDIFCKNQRCL